MKRTAFDAAEEELKAAARWYLARADELQRQVSDGVETIAESPRRFPVVMRRPGGLEVRRVLLRSYPYFPVYVDLPAEVRVLAFMHVRRRPSYWAKRVPRIPRR